MAKALSLEEDEADDRPSPMTRTGFSKEDNLRWSSELFNNLKWVSVAIGAICIGIAGISFVLGKREDYAMVWCLPGTTSLLLALFFQREEQFRLERLDRLAAIQRSASRQRP